MSRFSSPHSFLSGQTRAEASQQRFAGGRQTDRGMEARKGYKQVCGLGGLCHVRLFGINYAADSGPC